MNRVPLMDNNRRYWVSLFTFWSASSSLKFSSVFSCSFRLIAASCYNKAVNPNINCSIHPVYIHTKKNVKINVKIITHMSTNYKNRKSNARLCTMNG